MWPIWTISCSVAQSAHRLHVTLASKPPKRRCHQLLFRERERGSAPAAATSTLAVACARSPASCAVIADCRVPPTKLARRHLPLLARRHLPLLAHRYLPLLPPVTAASSATSHRSRLLLYSHAALTPSCSCHPDSPRDEQRQADPLALLPNPRRRDAPLVQIALALRHRLSDTLKTMFSWLIGLLEIVLKDGMGIYQFDIPTTTTVSCLGS
jgi:hypothetical protein